jgi:hypothetical protein
MKIEIFEPTLCCPTGVCGPEPDKNLIDLQNTIVALQKAMIGVDRYAINQTPLAFVRNQAVKELMQKHGPAKLPVTLLDGVIIKQESYPTIKDLVPYFPQLENMEQEGKILGIFS